MKRLLALLSFMTMWITSFGNPYAGYEMVCSLYATQPDRNNENPEDPPLRRRTPSAPILCAISEARGIEFLSGIKPEILYYEIHDSEGMSLTFAEEDSFIQLLFSMSGELKIVIVTPQWDYVGFVEL